MPLYTQVLCMFEAHQPDFIETYPDDGRDKERILKKRHEKK